MAKFTCRECGAELPGRWGYCSKSCREKAESRSLCDTSQSHNDLQKRIGTEGIPYEWVKGGSCSECKREFTGLHLKSKTTCSPKCRKKRERRQAASAKAFDNAMSELALIRSSLKRRENTDTFKQQLQRIKSEVNDLLVLAGDQEQLEKMAMFAARANRRTL